LKNAKKKNGAAAKGKGRAPLSAQQTIPYLSMHPDGVCKLPGGLYTKTVEYEDINYSVASTEDQTAIFSGWSSFLNYFDSSLPFQLSFIVPIPAAAIKSISRKRMTTITASGMSLPGC
jgi:hypothetical protein